VPRNLIHALMIKSSKPRQKKCRTCEDKFTPFNSMQVVCGNIQCAITEGKKSQKKANRKAKKEFYDNDSKAVKKKLTTTCHKYIRLRDKDKPCISCGRYDHEITEPLTGGKWDAGHWKTKAAFPEQRYNEYMIHKQCKSCNGGNAKYTKKEHSVSQSFKTNLIEKLGLKHVEWLGCYQGAQNLTLDDLKDITKYYKDKLKSLTT